MGKFENSRRASLQILLAKRLVTFVFPFRVLVCGKMQMCRNQTVRGPARRKVTFIWIMNSCDLYIRFHMIWLHYSVLLSRYTAPRFSRKDFPVRHRTVWESPNAINLPLGMVCPSVWTPPKYENLGDGVPHCLFWFSHVFPTNTTTIPSHNSFCLFIKSPLTIRKGTLLIGIYHAIAMGEYTDPPMGSAKFPWATRRRLEELNSPITSHLRRRLVWSAAVGWEIPQGARGVPWPWATPKTQNMVYVHGKMLDEH